MKKFFETLCCILLTLVLLIVVGNYFENKEEPKEDDPVVETPVEDETPSPEVLTLMIYNYSEDEVIISIDFEEGMTWRDWMNSEYYDSRITAEEHPSGAWSTMKCDNFAILISGESGSCEDGSIIHPELTYVVQNN